MIAKSTTLVNNLNIILGLKVSMLEYIKSLAQALKPIQIANFETCYQELLKNGLIVSLAK